jgi:hypothetical protein
MASTISAGTTAGTAIAIAGDTTGNLAFQTNGTTTAVTVDTSQNATFAGNVLGTPSTFQVGVNTTGKDVRLGVLSGGNGRVEMYTAGSELMRLSGGQVLAGTTSATGYYTNAKFVSGQDFSGKNNDGVLYSAENAAGTPFGALGLGASFGAASPNDIILLLQSNNSRYIYVQNRSAGVYLSQGATSWSSNSDERLKDIIEPIENAAEKVSTLRTVIGKYKSDEDGTRRAFLIAQDVKNVLPEAITKAEVKGDETEYMGVNYTDIIPLLTAAIKELNAKVVELEAKVNVK